jgi:uncharacterized membrane protein (DUF2068 family)
MTLTTNATVQRKSHDRFIRLIALFKFLKAILFVTAALGALGLMQRGIAERAREWATALAFTSGAHLVGKAAMYVTGLSRERIGALGLVALFYAALFATEGVGLWEEKRWAEYLTVAATGSLIPLEIWETIRHPTLARFATFVVNVAVVVYLIVRLRRPRGAAGGQTAAPNAAPAATEATGLEARSRAG